jgi:aspartyl-tRNA(Asn)/glutamyl-tRNA(Gln) amidotransferase subunit C
LKITEEQVRYVADLANLKVTAAEVARMAREMDSILSHIDKLNEADTSGVEPMAQVLFDADDAATWREDAERATLPNEEALANAPTAGQGFFKVPRVIKR